MREELERYAAALRDSGEYIVLEKFVRKDRYHEEDDCELLRGVFLDLETTGIDPSADKVIEIAVVPFEYSADGRIFGVGEAFTGLEDPGAPLSQFVKDLTGLTDEQVRGQRIDRDRLRSQLENVSLVVAHNAEFDRPFFERAFPEMPPMSWACSVKQVPWRDFGVDGRKLEYVAFRCGIYFDAHRAEVDCRVGIHLLAHDWGGGRSGLAAMLERVSEEQMRLWALGSPFETKDLLKARRYRWDVKRRAWYRDVAGEELEAEKSWLASKVYGELLRRKGRVRLSASPITARERFRREIEPSLELWLEVKSQE